MMIDLSERDLKAHRTIHHPDWCCIAGDDCWGAKLGYPWDTNKGFGEDYCKQCEFYKLCECKG